MSEELKRKRNINENDSPEDNSSPNNININDSPYNKSNNLKNDSPDVNSSLVKKEKNM